MSGARLSSVRKGNAVGRAPGRTPASGGDDTRPPGPAMTTSLRGHPAGLCGVGVAEPNGLPDLLELAGVVVPVKVEHGAEVHVDRDLVRAHELLEERDARLAPVEFPLLEPIDVPEQAAALGV